MEGWIQTYTGERIDPLNPRIEQIHFEDIARALSHLCRFTGHTKRFYSVAEHCYWASVLVSPDCSKAALLHDAAEAYLCDVAAPVKNRVAVFANDKMVPYKVAEKHLLQMIFEKFGLDKEIPEEVNEIDHRLCYTEGVQLMPDVKCWNWQVKPIKGLKLECWKPSNAYVMFMSRYERFKDDK